MGSAVVSTAVLGVSPRTHYGVTSHQMVGFRNGQAGQRDADQGVRDARAPQLRLNSYSSVTTYRSSLFYFGKLDRRSWLGLGAIEPGDVRRASWKFIS